MTRHPLECMDLMALIMTHTHTRGGTWRFDFESDQNVPFFLSFVFFLSRDTPGSHFKHHVWRVFKLLRSDLSCFQCLRIGEILFSGFSALRTQKFLETNVKIPQSWHETPNLPFRVWSTQAEPAEEIQPGCICVNMVVLVTHSQETLKCSNWLLDFLPYFWVDVWCFPFPFDHTDVEMTPEGSWKPSASSFCHLPDQLMMLKSWWIFLCVNGCVCLHLSLKAMKYYCDSS